MLFVVGFVLSIVVCLLLFVVVGWNLSVFLDRMLAPLSSIPDKRNCTRLLLGWKMNPRESSVQCTWDAAAEPVWSKCLECFGTYTQWHLTIMWITDIHDVEEIKCKTTVSYMSVCSFMKECLLAKIPWSIEIAAVSSHSRFNQQHHCYLFKNNYFLYLFSSVISFVWALFKVQPTAPSLIFSTAGALRIGAVREPSIHLKLLSI